MERIAPRSARVERAVLANLWLTRRLVLRRLQADSATNAMVRTTIVPTLFQAGTKDNVLPSYARAVVNVRLRQGDAIAAAAEHVRRTVDDGRVEIAVVGRFSAEPSPVSSVDSDGFRALERAIQGVVPGAIVAPSLVVVVTDSRHYTPLSRSVFRFLPLRLTTRDLARIHGIDERIPITEYHTAIRIYRQLLLETVIDATDGRS